MRLSDTEVKRFYHIWQPLLTFVNRERRLLPGVEVWDDDHPLAAEDAKVLRDALWADDGLRERFLSHNPAGLDDADLKLVDSWQHRVAGRFFILKHLKKHSIFQCNGKFYGVLGLYSATAELAPYLPFYVEAVLLPFEGRIIHDGLLAAFNITFGRNMRAELNREYQEARRRGEVITTLPSDKVPHRETAASGGARGKGRRRSGRYR
jgi:hypothetical protein